MSSHAQPRSVLPWPGPKPYRESERHLFHGRLQEARELVGRLKQDRFCVLSAGSGAGKTSLIHAALVPGLRIGRLRGYPFGFAVVVAGWGKYAGFAPHATLAIALYDALKELHERPPDDLDAEDRRVLESLQPPDVGATSSGAGWRELLAYVRTLCDALGRLVLVVDQAEELLGSGQHDRDRDRERALLGALAEVFRDEPRVSLLVSLREEYVARLRVLDQYGLQVDSRIMFLEPLAPETAEDAVRAAADSTDDVRLTPDAAAKIAALASGGEVRAFDLLGFQAILVGVYEAARPKDDVASSSPVLLDDAKLDAYLGQLRARYSTKEGSVVRMALRHHIERLLEHPSIAPAGIKRRLLARMAKRLSTTGGFKRHALEAELVYEAVLEDIRRMGVRDSEEEIRSYVQELGNREAGDVSPLKVSLDRRHVLSGSWLQAWRTLGENWRPTNGSDGVEGDSAPPPEPSPEAAQRFLAERVAGLVKEGYELLAYLASPNAQLLKSSSTLFGPSCELAHDGIGGALLDWSSSELLSVDEVRASPVSLGGQDFAWDDSALTGQFHYMCWLTCRLSGVTLKGVEFLHCTFKGMLFEDCTFIDCAFIDCDLSGAMFLGGSIGGAQKGRLRLDKCWASSLVMRGVELTGALDLGDSVLRFSQLEKFDRKADGSIIVRNGDLRNMLFHNMDSEWVTFVPAQDSQRRVGLTSYLPEVLRGERDPSHSVHG